MSHEYENMRRVSYEFGDELGTAIFIPVCPSCGRFVKSHDCAIKYWPYQSKFEFGANATCKKCGEVTMPFDSWM